MAVRRIFHLAPFYVGRKTADQSWTSSTTLAEVTDLSVGVDTNRVYFCEWWLFVSGDPAGDIVLEVRAPTGATIIGGAVGGMGQGTTSLVNADQHGLFSAGATVTYGLAGANQPNMIHITALVLNGTNAGNVRLFASQAVANAVPTTIRASSFVRAMAVQ